MCQWASRYLTLVNSMWTKSFLVFPEVPSRSVRGVPASAALADSISAAQWPCWAFLLLPAFHSTPHPAGDGCAGLNRWQNYFGSLEQVGTFKLSCPRRCMGSWLLFFVCQREQRGCDCCLNSCCVAVRALGQQQELGAGQHRGMLPCMALLCPGCCSARTVIWNRSGASLL